MSDKPQEPSKEVKRREFLTLGIGLGTAGLAAAIAGVGVTKFMIPAVTYGTPKKFKIPVDSIPDLGEELLLPEQKVLLRRSREGKLGAISLVCTHLGCTVARVTTGFQCPCHGSQYDTEGVVVGGPAPKTLPWLTIKSAPGGMVEIDTATVEPENSYYSV